MQLNTGLALFVNYSRFYCCNSRPDCFFFLKREFSPATKDRIYSASSDWIYQTDEVLQVS